MWDRVERLGLQSAGAGDGEAGVEMRLNFEAAGGVDRSNRGEDGWDTADSEASNGAGWQEKAGLSCMVDVGRDSSCEVANDDSGVKSDELDHTGGGVDKPDVIVSGEAPSMSRTISCQGGDVLMQQGRLSGLDSSQGDESRRGEIMGDCRHSLHCLSISAVPRLS